MDVTTSLLPQRLRAIAVAGFAAAFALAVAVIPRVDDLNDRVELASVAGSDTARWAWGYLLAVIAVGIGALAGVAIRGWLRDAERAGVASMLAVPLVVAGGVMLGAAFAVRGMGLAITIEAGGAGSQYLIDGAPWTSALQLAGGLGFSSGLILLGLEVLRSRALPPMEARIVLAATVVFAVAQGVPSGWALYVQAAVLLLAFLPLAWQMWPHRR